MKVFLPPGKQKLRFSDRNWSIQKSTGSRLTFEFSVREITLLKELKHPNVVDLKAICLDEDRIFLVFEYMNMDLKNYLDTQKGENFLVWILAY